MSDQNPFVVLMFSKKIVQTLRDDKRALRKIANSNQKWLQVVYHPDRDPDEINISAQLTEAVEKLEDDFKFNKYVQQFLSMSDEKTQKMIAKLRVETEKSEKLQKDNQQFKIILHDTKKVLRRLEEGWSYSLYNSVLANIDELPVDKWYINTLKNHLLIAQREPGFVTIYLVDSFLKVHSLLNKAVPLNEIGLKTEEIIDRIQAGEKLNKTFAGILVGSVSTEKETKGEVFSRWKKKVNIIAGVLPEKAIMEAIIDVKPYLLTDHFIVFRYPVIIDKRKNKGKRECYEVSFFENGILKQVVKLDIPKKEKDNKKKNKKSK